MTWAPGPVVTRRRLGGELKQLRERSGLKLDEVAKRLECSPSKISRLENGKGIPRTRDVRDMLEAYGVADEAERERLLEWSRTGQAPMWWRAYADVLPAGFDAYVELEWDAARIDAYESQMIHGLLQTRDYARAVLQNAWSATRSAEDVERMVEVRMRRQEALTPDHGLTLRCVLDEAALHRVVGSLDIMRAQLDHLIALAEAEHVDVRVLPFSAGIVAVNDRSMALLGFADEAIGRMVHLESPEGTAILSDPGDVVVYERRMTPILDEACTEADSLPLMRRAQRRLDDDPSV